MERGDRDKVGEEDLGRFFAIISLHEGCQNSFCFQFVYLLDMNIGHEASEEFFHLPSGEIKETSHYISL